MTNRRTRFAGFAARALGLLLASCNAGPTLPDTAKLQAADPSLRTARYLGNEGVMVNDGTTKILFDPLFDQSYNTYQLVPETIRSALMAGTPPFDGVDLMLISHAHGDHFSADAVLAYLQAHQNVKLVAPKQAIDLLKEAGLSEPDISSRVTAIEQVAGGPAVQIKVAGLTVEAITIPHSGGARMADIRNTVYRVHLGVDYQVLHLGDATTENPPFAEQQAFWDAQSNELVFTPYWLFKNPQRRANLGTHVRPLRAIGVHVPVDLAKLKTRYGTALDEVDLFTEPGEIRDLSE